MDNTASYSSRRPSSPSPLSFFSDNNHSHWFGMKRGRDGQPLVGAAHHPQSHFIISQEDDDDDEQQTSYDDDANESDDHMMQDVVMSGPCKRSRIDYSTTTTIQQQQQQQHPHHIPDVTFVPNPSNGRNFDRTSTASMSIDSSTTKEKINYNLACVPWWKQNKKLQRKAAPDSTCSKGICCVCQVEFDPSSTTTSRGNSATMASNVMPANALLAYFTPVQKASSSSLSSRNNTSSFPSDNSPTAVAASAASPRFPNNTDSSCSFSCTFCERMACSNCLVDCDGCQHSFCKFCVNKDYSEAYERTLCGDCCRQQHEHTTTSNPTEMSDDGGDSTTMMMMER